MTTLEHSLYHSCLRIAALTLALTLLFVSGRISPVTSELTIQTEQYLANVVGASAGVAPTELNQITAALTQQQASLDERERALEERALALGLNRDSNQPRLSTEQLTLINSLLLFIILVLLVINYGLDFSFRRSGVHNVS